MIPLNSSIYIDMSTIYNLQFILEHHVVPICSHFSQYIDEENTIRRFYVIIAVNVITCSID